MTVFSLLLFLLICYNLMMNSAQGEVNLESASTTIAEIEQAYKISDAQATLQYNQFGLYFPVQPSILCADGPAYKYYFEQDYFFWPPIRYRSCGGMTCHYRKTCAPVHTCVNYRWAIVYKCGKFGCHCVGVRYIRYTEHLDCHCKCNIHQCCPLVLGFNSTVCKCIIPKFLVEYPMSEIPS